jgi:hypothetical protein
VTSVDAGVFINPNLGGTALTIRELSKFQDQIGRMALLRRVIAYLVQEFGNGRCGHKPGRNPAPRRAPDLMLTNPL